MSKQEADGSTRRPPVHIPLEFEKAVEGLLGVDPREPDDDAECAENEPDKSNED